MKRFDLTAILIQLLLLILKLTHQLEWDWGLVLLPVWLYMGCKSLAWFSEFVMTGDTRHDW